MKQLCTMFIWLLALLGMAPATEPTLQWSFENVENLPGKIRGFRDFAPGVRGQCLVYDGFTTTVTNEPAMLQKVDLAKGFTLRAWVALGAYPWNWSPVLEQGQYETNGFSFGIDSNGQFGLGLKLGGQWVMCRSDIREELQAARGPKVDLDLRRWYDLAAVFDPGKAIRIYREGQLVKSLPLAPGQSFQPASDEPVFSGRSREPLAPSHPVRTWATYPAPGSLDGAVDELEIYERALRAEELAAAHAALRPEAAPPIASRDWPQIPRGRQFGAHTTTLTYYPQWDRLWRDKVTEHADIVVTFPDSPVKVVFWRGTRYSPCWVSENNKWMADQSREVGGNWDAKRPWQNEPTGCIEHMQDIQCRSSRVQIIENTPARVVVEWVYAQMDALQRTKPDRQGWPIWGRERYTFYPDGRGVRHVLPGEGGWQETIFLNAAGTRPEDNVEAEALTLATLDGKFETYSWANGYPSFNRTDAPIQMIHFKSHFKPFIVFQPGSRIKCFDVERRPEYSIFPWWNHWPVSMIASDGRNCQAADRASHSSLAWGSPRGECALYGMADEIGSTLSVAKSWLSPAEVTVTLPGGTNRPAITYQLQQRAWQVELPNVLLGPLELRFHPTRERPLEYPAFVLRNWGERKMRILVNGQPHKGTRIGYVRRLETTDAVVYLSGRWEDLDWPFSGTPNYTTVRIEADYGGYPYGHHWVPDVDYDSEF